MSHGGGRHLVPLLDRNGDGFITTGRLGKLGKADALHMAVTFSASSANFGTTVSSQTSRVGVHGPPGSPFVETVLCHSAVLKIRSFEPPAASVAANAQQGASLPPPGMTEEQCVLAKDVEATMERKPSELVWRMPHCYVRSIDALDTKQVVSAEAAARLLEDGDQGPPPGFVVTFFSTKSQAKAAPSPTVRRVCEAVPAVKNMCPPFELRAREYECATNASRDDWVLLYRAAVRNYWHQRLEASLMAAPEIYQFHTWAIDTGKNGLHQLALSTVALYAVPRLTNDNLQSDAGVNAVGAHRTVVSDVKRIRVHRTKAVVEVSSKVLNGSFQFFTATDAVRFVAELQRVWDTTHHYTPGQPEGASQPLPFEIAS